MTQPILVLAPYGRDAPVIGQLLAQAGLNAVTAPDLAGLVARLAGISAAVLTEEALGGPAMPDLFAWVEQQPAWSDLPFVVLVNKDGAARTGRRAANIAGLGNAVLLERPLNRESLASAARSALRARRRQLAMRDLTDTLETRVEQRTHALAITEQRFRAVFEGFPEGLFLLRVEPSGRVVYESRNAAAARRSGLADDQVIGAAPTDVLPPEYGAKLTEEVHRCIQAGHSTEFTGQVTFPGGPRIFEMTLTPMPDLEGGTTRVLGIARDVTERNRLEMRLRQAQKLEAIGQLTGGVAHDFNNLLQVVLSGLTLMERVKDPARQAQLADSVRRAAQRGGELTKRLLTVARRQSLQPQAVDLAAWLSDGAGELLRRALRGDIRTELTLPDNLPAVEVDPSELELAVLNLAVNARDAMPDGGTLSITAAPVTLDGSAAAEQLAGDFVALAVTDTGTGMDAVTQARVFEPFFTTKEVGKGTGLGLAQVYGFIKQSGGLVRLRSAPGQGTTVSLLLPVSHRAAATPAAPAAPRAAAGARASAAVLVVEDDEDVAALVIDMLAQLGHRPTLVTTAAAALGALADGRAVDLMFTDVLMPGGMDGLALAQEARRRRPGLPVLLTTGYTGAGALEAPADLPLLRKPYRLDELAAMLDRVLAPRSTEAA
ncbi:MAG: ATP-binding protein [Janthinobacterium lividum]